MSVLEKVDSMTKLYVYYGELDWCDPKTSFDWLDKSRLDISKEQIPNTGHVFMIENPFWIQEKIMTHDLEMSLDDAEAMNTEYLKWSQRALGVEEKLEAGAGDVEKPENP